MTNEPLKLARSATKGLYLGALAAGIALVTACGGRQDSEAVCARADSVAGAPSADAVETEHWFLLEIGGPALPTDVRTLASEIVESAIPVGSASRVLIVDGPNAAAFDLIALPGFRSDGSLAVDATNESTRRTGTSGLAACVESELSVFFDNDGDPAGLDGGRDILGALEWADLAGASSITLYSTSGGTHRDEFISFLAPGEIPQQPPNFRADIELTFRGIGAVPIKGEGTASKSITKPILRFYESLCSAHNGPCEVN